MVASSNYEYLITLLIIWAVVTVFAVIMDKDSKSLGSYHRLQRKENALDPEVQHAIHMSGQDGPQVCRYCGSALDPNSRYCSKCGKSQRSKLEHHFGGEFKNNIYEVNRWLADNPYITNVSADFGLSVRPGIFTYKSKLRSVDLIYEVSDRMEPHQYAVVELIKHKFFFTPDSHILIDKWKNNNPSAQIITSKACTYGRGTNGRITNHTMQVYMLVKFPDNQSPLANGDNFQNVKPKKNKKLIIIMLLVVAAAMLGRFVYNEDKQSLKDAVQKLFLSQEDTDKKTNEAVSSNKEHSDLDKQEDVQQADSQKIQYAVNTEGSMLNVRKSPKADGELLQKLANGTICEGTGNVTEDGWVEIIIPENGQTGWSSQKYLTVVQENEKTDAINNGNGVTSETENQSSTQTMSGNVTIDLIDKSEKDGTINIRITNNTDREVITFGNPILIISGESVELDLYSNLSSNQETIAAGTYKDITYLVDSRVFTEKSELSGELWTMDPNEQDRTYRLKIN